MNTLINYPKLMKEWHPIKNGDLKPDLIVHASTIKRWWICEKGHEWLADPAHRTNNRNCPYCSGNKVCFDNCLETLYSDLAKEWHPTKNGILIPKNVTSKTRKKVWWICEKGHEYEANISNRSGLNSGCPYCNSKKICVDNCLEIINPKLAKSWDYEKNYPLTPKDVFPGSHQKIWWKCSENSEHSWQTTINSRHTNNRGCPLCKNKNEQKVREIFESLFNNTFPRKKPSWMRNPETNALLELDGYNENLKLAFEYDGIFHDKKFPSKKSTSLENTKYKDKLKDYLCEQNGVTLIRIHYSVSNLEKYILDNLKLKKIVI